jgi:hypothetical protein
MKTTKRHKQKQQKRQEKGRNQRRHREGREGEDFPLRGITFDLCCGGFQVMKGLRGARGTYRVQMEAHGFELTLVLNEKQATDIGASISSCVAESKKEVN